MLDDDAIAALVWMLCLSAAVVLCPRDPRPTPMARAAAVLPYAAMLAVALLTRLSPAGLAVFAGSCCAWQLWRPSGALPRSLLAGALAGSGAAAHATMGAPLWMAAAISLLAWIMAWRWPLASAAAARTTPLALAALVPVSLLLAAAPGVRSGWQSAQALNPQIEAAASAMPGWVWQVALLAIAGGILHGVLVRR